MPQSGVGSYGFQVQVGKGTGASATEKFNFIRENLVKTQNTIDTSGLRGTRQHDKSRVRKGTYSTSGSLVMNPTPDELNKWLEYIQGGTPVVGTPAGATTFPPGETLPEFNLWVDKVVDVFKWSGCKVDFAEFRASQGGILEMELGIEGKNETPGETFPALTADSDQPFVIFDAQEPADTSALVINGTARDFREFSIRISNELDKERFLNYQYRTQINTIDRLVSFRALIPWTDDNYDLYGTSDAGLNGSLKFTNGLTYLNFVFGKLIIEDRSPPVEGRNELFFEVTGKLLKDGAENDLDVILDLT